jgi:hypothetical protein
MAMEVSRSYRAPDAFKALHNAFCDGVEVCVGLIASAKLIRSKGILADSLHSKFRTLTVKNILVQARGKLTVLWVTFSADSSKLDGWTMFQLRQLQTTVMDHV